MTDLNPSKHRFHRRAALFENRSHRFVFHFLALPHQRIVIRMKNHHKDQTHVSLA
jgi:hypothetical protein